VRRAQLAADSRDIETGTRQALQSSPGQSASSLRAISISQPAPEDVPELVVAQTGEFTRAGPPRQRPSKAALAAAFVGITLAAGVLATRLLTPNGSARVSASSAPEAGTPLLAPESAKPHTNAPSLTPSAVSQAPAADAVPHAAVAPASEPAVPPRLDAAKPKTTPASAPPRQKRSPSKKGEKAAANSGNSDLLAPDYAR
jgi:hypothetical protein